MAIDGHCSVTGQMCININLVCLCWCLPLHTSVVHHDRCLLTPMRAARRA
jgi:hypothetical protein